MTDFEEKVLERLSKIEENMKSINKRIYGNGQPGLDDKVTAIDKRLEVLASKQGWVKDSLAWLVTTGIAVYAAFFR